MIGKLFNILALSSEGFGFFGHFYLSVWLFFAILLAVFGHLLQKILLFWKLNLATLCIVLSFVVLSVDCTLCSYVDW